MSKVLVLYYSSYGHIEAMAYAVAEGAREAGAEVDVKRVPETVPEAIARGASFKLDQPAPIATVQELANFDAIVVGSGTRFGRVSSQMAAFLDQAGGLWMRGALHGKVGGAFTSTGTQHGGQEMTLFSMITNLLHFGMVIVGLDYGHAGQMTLEEITGGSPYGASTIAGGDGSRQPSANELPLPGPQDRRGGEQAARLESSHQPPSRPAHLSRAVLSLTSLTSRVEPMRKVCSMIEIGRVIIGSPFIVSDLSKLVAYGAGALSIENRS
jgi:NAD(P)H dehydrogenase (quinone)